MLIKLPLYIDEEENIGEECVCSL